MKSFIRKGAHISYIAGKRFFVENYTYRASALAYTTLLALVPLLSVIVFITSIFPVFNDLIKSAENYAFTNFLPTSNTIIQTYLESFVAKTQNLPTIGILFLFVTVGMLITTIIDTLNEVWQIASVKKRNITLLIYYLILIIAPLSIGIGIAFSSYLYSLNWFANTTNYFHMNIYLLAFFPYIINIIAFSILYIITPNCHVEWRDGLAGAIIAATLFEIAKKAFAFYLKAFPSYELIYGAIASIPIFLIWLYISWVIILYGALFTHSMYQIRKK